MFSCSPDKAYLLKLFWPEAEVFEDTLPLFLGDHQVILFSDGAPPEWAGKNVIHVLKSDKGNLDSRLGAFNFVMSKSSNIKESERGYFMSLSDEDFWTQLKLRLLVGPTKSLKTAGTKGSLYPLVNVLFTGFHKSFPVYEELGQCHHKVIAGLITVMCKKKEETDLVLDLIFKNNLALFKRGLSDYLKSRKDETDFLGFLARCGASWTKRPSHG
jgi:hypothetical protein